MENETITSIVQLLQGGGSAVTLLAVWVAFKASQTATDAVKTLHEIRDAVIGLKVVTQSTAQVADTIDERTADMRRAADILELRVTAALSKLPQG